MKGRATTAPRPLAGYSDEELMDELSSRMHERREREALRWCDRCAHFQSWDAPGRAHLPMPEKFNPCTKGHKMSFQTPAEYDDEWGFYRTHCRDRSMPATEDDE